MSEQEKQPDNQTTQPVKKKKTCRKILCVGSAVIFIPVLGVVTALSFDSGQRALIQLADKMLRIAYLLSKSAVAYKMV